MTMNMGMPKMPGLGGMPQLGSSPGLGGGLMKTTQPFTAGAMPFAPQMGGLKSYRNQMGMQGSGFGKNMLNKLMTGGYQGGALGAGGMGLNQRQQNRFNQWQGGQPQAGPFGDTGGPRQQVMPGTGSGRTPPMPGNGAVPPPPTPGVQPYYGFGPNPNDPASVAWWSRPYEPNDVRYFI